MPVPDDDHLKRQPQLCHHQVIFPARFNNISSPSLYRSYP
jgi:hypothetical protein